MSRSRRKHLVLKDKTGRWYNKVIRRRQGQQVRDIPKLSDLLTYEITQPKVLVNDWDICDWKFVLSKRRWANIFSEKEFRKARCK